MTYYAIINEQGEFFTGGAKLSSPLIYTTSPHIDDAKVYRDKGEANAMRRRIQRTQEHTIELVSIDSRLHKRLAD